MLFRAYGVRNTGAAVLAGWLRGLLAVLGLALAGCSSSIGPELGPMFGSPVSPAPLPEVQPQNSLGAAGGVRVGLILSLSADGNAGAAAQSMRNAAELALAEFANPNIQLIVKDDAGTAQGAQAAVVAALAEGAEIILGPLFSHSVAAAGQLTRNRSIPMIAFSTDTNVAARGVYLLSFLPESDVERIVGYAIANGKKSFLALLPDNIYGTVIEGGFKQAVAARKGRVVALEHYLNEPARMAEPVRKVASSVKQADAIFIADAADATPQVVQLLNANGVSSRRIQYVGTGLWDDPQLFSDPNLNGAWFAAPDITGFRAFAQRYKARFGRDPVRTASLAYDAVSLIAALVKTQGPNRFSEEALTNPSGFNGIDGVFRFRSDGTCERGLAVMEIRNGTARVISPAPRSFTSAAL
ncbi:MAG: penicillin-binding protein activator [Xanthobacteraceae bacterium]|nr:penicillin-binding protein activator [Xanthobacteraceae bacterium]